MENWEKIEVIITTVADYYGIKWVDLWRMDQRNVSAKNNMIKLIRDVMGMGHLAIEDLFRISRSNVKHAWKKIDDDHYDRLSHEIRVKLVPFTYKQTA